MKDKKGVVKWGECCTTFHFWRWNSTAPQINKYLGQHLLCPFPRLTSIHHLSSSLGYHLLVWVPHSQSLRSSSTTTEHLLPRASLQPCPQQRSLCTSSTSEPSSYKSPFFSSWGSFLNISGMRLPLIVLIGIRTIWECHRCLLASPMQGTLQTPAQTPCSWLHKNWHRSGDKIKMFPQGQTSPSIKQHSYASHLISNKVYKQKHILMRNKSKKNDLLSPLQELSL